MASQGPGNWTVAIDGMDCFAVQAAPHSAVASNTVPERYATRAEAERTLPTVRAAVLADFVEMSAYWESRDAS